MPEPTTTTAASVSTVSAAGISVTPLVILGVNMGLRADLLMAGFAGAIAGIVLLSSVPSEGDTWKHLLRTTLKRVFVSFASALTAGYLTPMFLLPIASPDEAVVLAFAFGIGAGAQRALRKAIDKITPTAERDVKGDAK